MQTNMQTDARQALAYCDTLTKLRTDRPTEVSVAFWDDCGYCLDAPEVVPAGSMIAPRRTAGPSQRVTWR